MANGFFDSLFNEAFNALSEFDALYNEALKNQTSDITVANKAKECIQFGTDPSGFPRGDLAEDKDGNYHIIFSIGGYSENDIDIDYKDSYITLTLHRPEDYGKDWKFLVKQLKFPSIVRKSTLIDTRKYDVSKITWTMLPNNLLDIKVQKRQDFISEYSIKKSNASIADESAKDKKEEV